MKKVLLFPVALLAALSLFAQPTLQNNVFPDIGDVATTASGDTLNIEPGNAGANQTWDFTNLHIQTGTVATQAVYVAVEGTPYAASFPTANIAVKINEGTTAVYSYARKETGQFSSLGTGTDGFLQTYTDPEIVLKAPLNFNGSFEDDYAYTTDAGNDLFLYTEGSQTLTYDAYGTLKTPLGNFNNAIRTKSVSSQVDSATISGFVIINHTNSITYDWLVANQAGPVVSISYTSSISETRIPGIDTTITETPLTKSVSYISAAATSVFSAPTALSGLSITALGPNPAVDQLTLRFDAENSGQALRVLITDATGKEVENQSIRTVAGENTWSLPVGRLAAGNYFLTLTDGRGVMTKGWVKQ